MAVALAPYTRSLFPAVWLKLAEPLEGETRPLAQRSLQLLPLAIETEPQ